MTGTRPMSFFVTSTPGKGADYGGLAGADLHCQQLAAANGAGGKTWRAYLSTQGKDGVPTVNARDRIGTGPWLQRQGRAHRERRRSLHGAGNNVTKQTALEREGPGRERPRRHAEPPRHPRPAPSRTARRSSPNDRDMTCANWTRSGAEGTAVVGHHDRQRADERSLVHVVEFLARVARRLQHRGAQGNGRRRAPLLLRYKLSATRLPDPGNV